MATNLICKIDGCIKHVAALGLCDAHYRRYKRYGNAEHADQRFRADRPCSVDGCSGSAHWSNGGKRGWCAMHYMRWWTNGDPLAKKCAANGEGAEWLVAHSGFSGDACLKWPFGEGPNGYSGVVTVNGEGDYAHRQMCRIAHGEPPTPEHQAAHSCGKGHEGCVHPQHVRWATPLENSADRIDHGNSLRGELAPSSTLTVADVKVIRALDGKLLQREIAEVVGTTRANVSSVLRRKSWDWLE